MTELHKRRNSRNEQFFI